MKIPALIPSVMVPSSDGRSTTFQQLSYLVGVGGGIEVNGLGKLILSTPEPFTVVSTDTILLSGDGSVGEPLTATVVLDGSVPGNMIVASSSGISVKPLQVTNALDGSLAITISGDAAVGQTVTGSVNVSATELNLLHKNLDGLYVPPTDTISGNGLNLEHSVVDGVESITGSIVIDPTPTNLATVSSAGVLVDRATIADSLFNTQVQDAFGVHLGWMDTGTSFAP